MADKKEAIILQLVKLLGNAMHPRGQWNTSPATWINIDNSRMPTNTNDNTTRAVIN